jgi:predicted CoA-substrate-specific enzyme activase
MITAPIKFVPKDEAVKAGRTPRPAPAPGAAVRFMIGLDVGSTTVKAVVIDVSNDEILWSDYQRHDTKQPEKTLELLKEIEAKTEATPENTRIFVTGSGGGNLAPLLGAKFVQEVNAVSLAVERLYPEAGSVIELGGQDAKIIIFKEDPETGKKRKIPSMNDKCAGGTGAVIDKINAKLRIPAENLCQMGYEGVRLHPVAGKCGVFAETDINGLQKQGVPPPELMASLFEAIVMQNLSVLTRGNTLRPHVLLLGGPNTYIKGMVDCWKHNIPKIWEERNTPLPEGAVPADLVRVPERAHLFAAIGACEFGKTEELEVGRYTGWQALEEYITVGREKMKSAKKGAGGGGLAKDEADLSAFQQRYQREKFTPATFQPGQVVEGFIGVDGGSTSTKAVLMNSDRQLLVKAYQLSKGNPIEDTMEMFRQLREYVEQQGAVLEVKGVGTTGYAKDILKDVLAADAALVETVAHTESARHFYEDVDVICDVGGQDIKVIVLKNGQVKDFKLNTQCSAGNGYFLQSTAEGFGLPVEEFADVAFSAKAYPQFGYGCAVFMQSDIVDFQRQGWEPKEIMAGLANVLPKNIWLYVAQIPNLARLGKNFVLQGGTQYNLAAVKSQVDFIESRYHNGGDKPNVWVHKHAGESGAIGAALEAVRLFENGRRGDFIGLDEVADITYKTSRGEETRCYFCKNKCLRTFIDVKVGGKSPVSEAPRSTKVPLDPGSKRLIIATCEKGTVEDVNDMREIKKGLDAIREKNPNLVEEWAHDVFKIWSTEVVADPVPARAWLPKTKERIAKMARRKDIRVGIPRVLNVYSTAPFFSGYLASLGLDPKNIVYSDYTSEQLYKDGAKRGSIDPCFPSKVANSHVHNLIFQVHAKKPLDYIFFPMLDCLLSPLKKTQAARVCPTVAATPAAVKASWTKEGDVFKDNGIEYLDTFINLSERHLCSRQMWLQWGEILGLSREEHERAMDQAYLALDRFDKHVRRRGREVIEMCKREERIAIVLLARPYHNDPGISHEIPAEFQKLGYPVLAQDSLPLDEDILDEVFGEEVRQGIIGDPMEIRDVWKNSYSENTSRKVWAAKFTARHPNLVALEMSNFKCGHDAPIYSVIEEIIENSGTPYFYFKDIDENKPTGSIRIRVETIDYFLTRYRENIMKKKVKREEVEAILAQYEAQLRAGLIAAGTPLEDVLATFGGANGNGRGARPDGTSPVVFKRPAPAAAEEVLA